MAEATASSLFQAMRTLEASADDRARYGAQGASIVRRRHTVPAMVSQYERLYRSVLGLPTAATPVAGEPLSRGMTVDA